MPRNKKRWRADAPPPQFSPAQKAAREARAIIFLNEAKIYSAPPQPEWAKVTNDDDGRRAMQTLWKHLRTELATDGSRTSPGFYMNSEALYGQVVGHLETVKEGGLTVAEFCCSVPPDAPVAGLESWIHLRSLMARGAKATRKAFELALSHDGYDEGEGPGQHLYALIFCSWCSPNNTPMPCSFGDVKLLDFLVNFPLYGDEMDDFHDGVFEPFVEDLMQSCRMRLGVTHDPGGAFEEWATSDYGSFSRRLRSDIMPELYREYNRRFPPSAPELTDTSGLMGPVGFTADGRLRACVHPWMRVRLVMKRRWIAFYWRETAAQAAHAPGGAAARSDLLAFEREFV